MNSQFNNSGYQNISAYKKRIDPMKFFFSSGLVFILGSSKLSVSISSTNFSHNTGCIGGNINLLFFKFVPVIIYRAVTSLADTLHMEGVPIFHFQTPTATRLEVEYWILQTQNLQTTLQSFMEEGLLSSGSSPYCWTEVQMWAFPTLFSKTIASQKIKVVWHSTTKVLAGRVRDGQSDTPGLQPLLSPWLLQWLIC